MTHLSQAAYVIPNDMKALFLFFRAHICNTKAVFTVQIVHM